MLKKENKKNRILLKDTEWIKEWDYEKNKNLNLEKIYTQSNYYAWWKCQEPECGHEWRAKISHRTGGTKCQACRLRRSSLKRLYPNLALEWDEVKNQGLTPDRVFAKSSKKVWWKCSEGHQWEASPVYRLKNYGCPICRCNQRLSQRSLIHHRSDLVKEWDAEKNKAIDLSQIALGSQRRVWWKCGKGHEWQATVQARTSKRGCPQCLKDERLKENSLSVKNPKLATEWHPSLNADLTPHQIAYKSNRSVWWQCSKGHEWETTVLSRSNGAGCFKCLMQQKREKNLLSLKSPELMREWHPTKNKNLTPEHVTIHSPLKVWWIGACGHEWEQSVKSRYQNSACPVCLRETKRFVQLYPELKDSFDREKNQGISVEQLFIDDLRKIWWKCPNGHTRHIRIKSFIQRPACHHCRSEMNQG